MPPCAGIKMTPLQGKYIPRKPFDISQTKGKIRMGMARCIIIKSFPNSAFNTVRVESSYGEFLMIISLSSIGIKSLKSWM